MEMILFIGMMLFVSSAISNKFHNITFYASSYQSMSHNYESPASATKQEAEQMYPFYLNAPNCELDIGFPSSKYETHMVLFCSNNEFNPANAPYIDLQIGKNEISSFKLNASLYYDQSGFQKYNFFWFGQLTLSVWGTQFNATTGANATLSCYNLSICNATDYCVEIVQEYND